ncbi:hypothetical protein NDU88_006726 [Pleurodeles waltl]|uniref:Uncharacterized protein n=1 Tax=Pleurodeles waltl TaxID=8319 RepID=A0AAV7TXM3_PLEWA|nr:hypothetical protein NDU88_006726 [Pleurodeles waltl]
MRAGQLCTRVSTHTALCARALNGTGAPKPGNKLHQGLPGCRKSRGTCLLSSQSRPDALKVYLDPEWVSAENGSVSNAASLEAELTDHGKPVKCYQDRSDMLPRMKAYELWWCHI